MAEHRKLFKEIPFSEKTDQDKLFNVLSFFDEKTMCRGKTVIGCKKRFVFDNYGELIKVQELIFNKEGKIKKYINISEEEKE